MAGCFLPLPYMIWILLYSHFFNQTACSLCSVCVCITCMYVCKKICYLKNDACGTLITFQISPPTLSLPLSLLKNLVYIYSSFSFEPPVERQVPHTHTHTRERMINMQRAPPKPHSHTHIKINEYLCMK